MRMCQFLGPKWPIGPNKNFFRKSVNKPCSCHSWLSTFQKSKSDINLLMKYWQLKTTEISLAESHFWPYNLRTRLFLSMQFSQKWLRAIRTFCFTPMPDKSKDLIFLKSPKILYLGHFWSFLVIFTRWGFFRKNSSVSHITKYGPLTPR